MSLNRWVANKRSRTTMAEHRYKVRYFSIDVRCYFAPNTFFDHDPLTTHHPHSVICHPRITAQTNRVAIVNQGRFDCGAFSRFYVATVNFTFSHFVRILLQSWYLPSIAAGQPSWQILSSVSHLSFLSQLSISFQSIHLLLITINLRDRLPLDLAD